MKDVVIIGAGVVGAAVARYLSRFELEIVVLEKENDVSCATSKANSGIVHAGFDATPNSQKAKFNVEGNKMFDKLQKELDFPFVRSGALVLAFRGDPLSGLEELYNKGQKNGVKGLSIISGQEARALESQVSPDVDAALYAPTSGIVGPYEMTIALCENAATNGVQFLCEKEVTNILKTEGGYKVCCKDGFEVAAKVIINCAGVFADQIHNMVCSDKVNIRARKGEYMLYDKTISNPIKHTLFQLPSKMGKGVLITPTAHGNILIGPTATEDNDKTNTATTISGLSEVFEKAKKTIPSLNKREVITQFAGIRAHLGDDFLIGESAPMFFDACGIESPGLTAAPAIGKFLSEKVAKALNALKKENFIAKRKAIPAFHTLDNKHRERLIKADALFGRIICRCEEITEAEIVQAIRRVPSAKDLDGVKRRTRAGMGRCQGGFCGPRVLEIIARETNMPIESISKCGKGSEILTGVNKDSL